MQLLCLPSFFIKLLVLALGQSAQISILDFARAHSSATRWASSSRPFSGTYTVKADCTGTSTYPENGFEYKYDLFIAPDGSMFTFVQTKPTEGVASGVERRVTPRRVGD
jgi:hypothetical protein